MLQFKQYTYGLNTVKVNSKPSAVHCPLNSIEFNYELIYQTAELEISIQ